MRDSKPPGLSDAKHRVDRRALHQMTVDNLHTNRPAQRMNLEEVSIDAGQRAAPMCHRTDRLISPDESIVRLHDCQVNLRMSKVNTERIDQHGTSRHVQDFSRQYNALT